MKLCDVMRHVLQTEWPATEVLLLIRLREQNLSYREIAARLNRTEHSVASKVRVLLRRQGLPSVPRNERPQRAAQAAATPEPVHRAGKSTLPPLASLVDK